MPPVRVLHAPWNIGGHAATLARAERSLGVDSQAFALRPDGFGFGADTVMTARGDGPLAIEWGRLRLLRLALQADVLHLNFGQSLLMPEIAPDLRQALGQPARRIAWHVYARLMFMRDLPLLRAAGVRIVVTFQGDDVRQGDRSLALFDISIARANPGYYLPHQDAWKRKIVKRFDRWADALFTLNPDLAYMLPPRTRFLAYAHVDPAELSPVEAANEVPVIVHAPSNRQAKGTDYVLRAVAQLQRDGIRCELDLVEGLDHRQAKERYARADIVIDNVLGGWYGGIAVEAMSMGKPVIAYMRDADLSVLPTQMREEIPVISAPPERLELVMREVLGAGRRSWLEAAARGRRYVERWHAPQKVAAQTSAAYYRILGRHPEAGTEFAEPASPPL